jgi:hypothetical protein
VTFKELKKRVVTLVDEATEQQQSKIFSRLYRKPFWIWIVEEHKQEAIKTKGDCCFNHIIGLPTKGRVEKPLFEYEKLLYDSLLVNDYSNILNHTFKHKHIWVKKATGLGFTECFTTRYN